MEFCEFRGNILNDDGRCPWMIAHITQSLTLWQKLKKKMKESRVKKKEPEYGSSR